MTKKRILVPIDGSDTSTRALDFAIDRARLHDATIVLVNAVNRLSIAIATANPYGYVDPTPLLEALDEEAKLILDAGDARIKQGGVVSECVKLDGLPAPCILNYVKNVPVDCIVMGTHGRRGFERFAVGSTAEGVIRVSTVPVFVVPRRNAELPHGALKRGLIAMDGSPAADLAFAYAEHIARIERTQLIVCSVVEPAGPHADELDRSVLLEEEQEQHAMRLLGERVARADGVAIGSKLLHGDAAGQIVAYAAANKVDCIFVGTHGRAGIPRFILGSVAEGILRTSTIPVCTARHR